MSPAKGGRRPGQQRAHHLQALVHPPPPGGRVDAADLDLVPILTTDPDPEDQPARREPGEVGQLPGHRHRVAQRQEVEPAMDRQCRMQHRQGGGLEQPVEARTAGPKLT